MANLFKGTTIGKFAGPQTLFVAGHVTEAADPAGGHGSVIRCELHKEDTTLAPPSEDARIQLSSGAAIPKEKEVWLLQRFMVPSLANGGPPAVTNAGGGFLQIMQLFAPPFETGTPLGIKLEDWNNEGTNWLQFRRNGNYAFDSPWRRKVVTDHWYELQVKAKVATAGWVEMWLDGEQLTFWKEGETSTPANTDTTKLEYETLQAGVNDGAQGWNQWMSTVYRKKGEWEPFSLYFDTNSIATTQGDLEPVARTIKEQLESLAVFDTLERTENPLAAEWESGGTTNTGQATATGWTMTAEKVNAGAKLKTAKAFGGTGGLLMFEVPVIPLTGQSLEMQFGVSGEAQRAGLAIVKTASGKCRCTLFGAASGEQSEIAYEAADSFGLSWHPAGALTAWRKHAGTWTEILSRTGTAPSSSLKPAIFFFPEGLAGTEGRAANFGWALLEEGTPVSGRSPLPLGPFNRIVNQ